MAITLMEELALAVLRGDVTACDMLADRWIEERTETQLSRARDQVEVREHPMAVDGFEVYRWPEFQAFVKRLGFMWDLRTIDVTIRIACGERIKIEHTYAASNIQAPNSIETTTLQNEEYTTHSPPAAPQYGIAGPPEDTV